MFVLHCKLVPLCVRKIKWEDYIPWASCKIRKITNCATTGNAGNVFPASKRFWHSFWCVRHAHAVMHAEIANSWKNRHIANITPARSHRYITLKHVYFKENLIDHTDDLPNIPQHPQNMSTVIGAASQYWV